jgi:hypothetical protein
MFAEDREENMVRAYIWFRCAAMHDPVCPKLVKPAVLGWAGKNRNIDLVIERELTGQELLLRMKGWITINPRKAVEVFSRYGFLKCYDDGKLVVELETREELDELNRILQENFGDQVSLEEVGVENA